MELVEEYKKSIDIRVVCRICLQKEEEMCFIYENGLADILFDCTSIQISLDENPYNLICNKCSAEVTQWYIFKQKVLRSFEIGSWLIKQIGSCSPILKDNCNDINEFNAVVTYTESDLKNTYINTTDPTITNGDETNKKILVDNIIQVEGIQGSDLKICTQIQPDMNDIPAAVDLGIGDSTSENRTTVKSTCDKETQLGENTKTLEIIKINLNSNGEFICDICNRVSPNKNALMRHRKVHRETKDYVCTKCGKAFKQTQTLAEHLKRHYDLRKYACEICAKRFYKQYNLNMHMRMHTGEKPYKCTECNKAFTRPLLLRNHIKQRHTDDKQHMCQICGKGFIDSWQLKIHDRSHTGEKPHKCQYCDKAFAVSSSLFSHIRYKHTFEKNFICNICAKAFTAKHTLDDHIRTHTGEKKEPRHECKVCGKKCDTTSTLKYHMRAVHTGERPFICDVCNKRFVRKQHLKEHMRNHTGEKPYVCTCGKAFSASSSFSLHKRMHTGERPFVCAVCGQSYVQSAGLRQHMKRHKT